MNAFHFLTAALFALTSASALGAIKTQTVEYKQGDTVLEGYLAYDSNAKGARPGIVIVHDWRGLGDYPKQRAEMLAKMGYVAFAADIYGKGVRPADDAEASKVATVYKTDRGLMRQRAQAALDELLKQKNVNRSKVAAIGYCFGGTTALELGRSGAPLAGIVSFHGGLDTPTPKDAANIKAKVLALHGADDPFVPEAQVKGFEDEMRAGKVDWTLVKYSGAVHSFTNPKAGNDPSKGQAYNAKADERSWIAAQDFFKEIFK